MTWYEYLAAGGAAGGVVSGLAYLGGRIVRAVHGVLLARMALKHNQPLAVDQHGGYQLGEAALARKSPESKDGKQVGGQNAPTGLDPAARPVV